MIRIPFLYSDEGVQKVFWTPTMISYRSATKIKDYIVRSKLLSVERKVRCQCCGNSSCQFCKSINITDEFTSFNTKKLIKQTARLVVNSIKVITPTMLEVDGIKSRWKKVFENSLFTKWSQRFS